jgi:glucose/mannose-6-phosphate isomerase
MKELVENFAGQLEEASNIALRQKFSVPGSEIRNVLISGLGGSGIGGSLIQELVAADSPVPVVINKDYFLPSFASKHTLSIIVSYSGNTEETIQCLHAALEKSCHVVCISSGGEVVRLAKEKGLDHVIIPGGMPPRACLSYSMVQLLNIFKCFKLGKDYLSSDLQQSIALIRQKGEVIREKAREVASGLRDKIPVIYTVPGFEAVAVRMRQQLNENAKVLCWHHVIPEMNHNELVGWTTYNPALTVLLLRNADDYVRIRKRIEICKEIISKYTPNLVEVFSEGVSRLEKMIYLIHFGDWVSVFLAEMKQVDPVEVKVIDYLKKSMAKD